MNTELKEWHTIFFKKQNVLENNVGGKLLFKEYALEQFIDESSTISSLEDFQACCNQNDISINLKEESYNSLSYSEFKLFDFLQVQLMM